MFSSPYRLGSVSATEEYAQSRIGDGAFFIEKVLDQICNLDDSCVEAVASSRQALWPDYHEDEAKKDAERERLEAEAKKRRAKERQRQMMEQLAQQRKRFMSKMGTEENIKNEGEPSGQEAKMASSSSQGKSSSGKNTQGSDKHGSGSGKSKSTAGAQSSSTMTEYTCCHCLLQTPATEARPIGETIS